MEAKYPKGFKIWEPTEATRAKAPWIKGRISVHLQTFNEWADQFVDEKGYVSLDLKQGDDQSFYAQVNTWKPDATRAPAPQTPREPLNEEDVAASIPF